MKRNKQSTSPKHQMPSLVDFDYFVWKWAENDEKGKPHDVFASLMRGQLHLALKPFSENYDDLFKPFLTSCFSEGGTCFMENVIDKTSGLTIAIHLTGKHSNPIKALGDVICHTDLEACSVFDGTMTKTSLPKHYFFRFDDLNYAAHPPVFDFEYDELPVLLSCIDSRKGNSFGILKDAHGSVVQVYGTGSQYCVEWYGWSDWKERTWKHCEHFRATKGQSAGKSLRLGTQSRGVTIKDNEVLSFADVLTCFQAFYRHETKPTQYIWRNINKEIEIEKNLPESERAHE